MPSCEWSLISHTTALFLAEEAVMTALTTICSELMRWSRLVRWGSPSTRDVGRFPSRMIVPSPTPRVLPTAPAQFPIRWAASGDRLDDQAFRAFLDANRTTSFLVVRDGTLVFEHYGNGVAREDLVGCFSVTKSVLSALVGIALGQGAIGSVDDLLTDYIPELPRVWAEGVTLRHLLTMTCGLRYSDAAVPWSEGARLYHSPDRWATLQRIARRVEMPGAVWSYNDLSPALIEMVLRRSTGVPLASYAQRNLFDPLGMAHEARWTLDRADGVESAASGLFCTARTLALFGQLFLDRGRVADRQIIPEPWVEACTMIEPSDLPAARAIAPLYFEAPAMAYKNYWWLQSGDQDGWSFAAIGVLGQYVYMCPNTQTIVIRTGHDWGRFGNTSWFKLIGDSARSRPVDR